MPPLISVEKFLAVGPRLWQTVAPASSAVIEQIASNSKEIVTIVFRTHIVASAVIKRLGEALSRSIRD